MPYTVTRLQRTYKTTEPVARYLGVVQNGEGKCSLPAADNAMPLGIVTNDEQPRVGNNVAVMLEGIAVIKAGGTVTAGQEVVLKAGGSVIMASTLAAGTKANIVGIAETSGVTDELISVRIQIYVREM